MHEKHLAALERLGLSTAEAQIYLALVRNGTPMGASAVVAATGVPRSSVYPTLTRLADLGLVESEAGYGGRFSAIPAERALHSLIGREREELSQRQEIAAELVAELKSLGEPRDIGADAEQIQVFRDPRVAAERFERLQLEAQQQVDAFIKAPFFIGSSNPAQEQALRRGVRYRGLYEEAVLSVPEVKPYLETWVAAGEEARIYKGELPHKLAIFDSQNILLPLVTPGSQGKTLFIRHPQLAAGLGMLFESLWQTAEPVRFANRTQATTKRSSSAAKNSQRDGAGHSHRTGRPKHRATETEGRHV